MVLPSRRADVWHCQVRCSAHDSHFATRFVSAFAQTYVPEVVAPNCCPIKVKAEVDDVRTVLLRTKCGR